MKRTTWNEFKASLATIRKFATDEQALNAIGIYPEWKPDTTYAADIDRVQYEDGLYKCRQSHTSQAIYPPNIIPALWLRISSETGTIDNPIAYTVGLSIEQGKYYVENDVKYRCITSLDNAVWHLSELIGIYVEVVTV